MSYYFIPAEGKMDDVAETLSRAGIPFANPQTVRELITNTSSSVVVAAVPLPVLLLVSQHPEQYFEEMPSVIHSAPGMLYQPEWQTTAALFAPMDWMEFERKTKRSGQTAYTPEQGEGRMKRLPSAEEERFTELTDPVSDDTEVDDALE